MMGGDCVGRSVVARYFRDNAWYDCRNCNCFEHDDQDGNQCQVLNGQEDTWHCPELQEVLHRNEVPVPKRLNIKRWP